FVVWLVFDFAIFINKRKKINKIIENLSIYPSDFPTPKDCIEKDYQSIINHLYSMIEKSISKIEKNNNEQSEYYTMWVHQIKTPISAIRLAVSTEKENIPTNTRNIIETELFKIEQYTEMALQYAKMQNLSSDMVIEKSNILALIKESVKKYAPLFIYKKLSLELDDNLDFEAYTDKKWFSFLFEQLISNSIKYTHSSGSIKIYADENKRIVITDSGIGISSSDINRIFEKGFTGTNGRIDKKASGIGLYMVKKISEELKIKIEITSEIGKGTTVFLKPPYEETEIFDNITNL
ncbi:MAG: sensor histidine kinase, partial [Clostridiales bacterium]|nr:sensor histidine kinase [Clostridiales bacterium]